MNTSKKISVIVASYKPNLNKMKRTLISVLLQEKVEIEIIVSDDGSPENYFAEIEKILLEYGMSNYKLVTSNKNRGTCQNYLAGLKVSSGEYVKLISPGDYLYSKHTLFDWQKYMRTYQAEVSFGEATYYNYQNEQFTVLQEKSYPQRAELYQPNHYRAHAAEINYLCLYDAILGANFLMKKNLLERYLTAISKDVVYSEDNIYRMLLVDGIKIAYYPENVLYYEYGTGISTSQVSKWDKIIEHEMLAIYHKLSEEMDAKNFFDTRLKYLLSISSDAKRFQRVKYFVFPSLIYWKLMKYIKPTFTKTCVDEKFVERIHLEDSLK